MGWATRAIERLEAGETVTIRPRGHSMEPRVSDGQECVVEPPRHLRVGDVVLCRVDGREYLHLIKRIEFGYDGRRDRFLIGNNKGRINGWTTEVYGKLA